MAESLTKTDLLNKMRALQADWEAMFGGLTEAETERAESIGRWAIKDVVFHTSSYAGWFVEALQAALDGNVLPRFETELTIDEHNEFDYEQSQSEPLHNVLSNFRIVLQRLIALTEAHSEPFLTQPQQTAGVAEPIVIAQSLDQVCNHYRSHLQAVRDSLDAKNS
jgi:hypothetical protein